MSKYSVESVNFAKAMSDYRWLLLTATFVDKKNISHRQKIIEYLIEIYQMDDSAMKSIKYINKQPSGDKLNIIGATHGQTSSLDGSITIYPSAFRYGYEYLATVIYHEIIHSHQVKYNLKIGIHSMISETKNKINKIRLDNGYSKAFIDIERKLVAISHIYKGVMEYEAYYWGTKKKDKLGLKKNNAILNRISTEEEQDKIISFCEKIDIDHSKIINSIKNGKFNTVIDNLSRWLSNEKEKLEKFNLPSKTKGPMGLNDGSDPNTKNPIGFTRGSMGLNDVGDPNSAALKFGKNRTIIDWG